MSGHGAWHRLDGSVTLAVPALAFCVGAWVALVVRALFADAAHRRMQRAATDALTPEQFDHLREYLDEIDEAERHRVKAKHGGTLVHLK